MSRDSQAARVEIWTCSNTDLVSCVTFTVLVRNKWLVGYKYVCWVTEIHLLTFAHSLQPRILLYGWAGDLDLAVSVSAGGTGDQRDLLIS